MRWLSLLLLFASSCSYVLPATWRDFRAAADDAVPAITKALDERKYRVEDWDQEKNEMRTEWVAYQDGIQHTRERYLISWERNDDDHPLTDYERHEAQEKGLGNDGAEDWGTTYHSSDKEQSLMDAITKEIVASFSFDG